MAKLTSRNTLRQLQTQMFECARCKRQHNGAGPPPGWGHAPGHGLICDDCADQLHAVRITGQRRKSEKGSRHAA